MFNLKMEVKMNFFVSTSLVINRAPTAEAVEVLGSSVSGNSCECVNCHSCDNSCNR